MIHFDIINNFYIWNEIKVGVKDFLYGYSNVKHHLKIYYTFGIELLWQFCLEKIDPKVTDLFLDCLFMIYLSILIEILH